MNMEERASATYEIIKTLATYDFKTTEKADILLTGIALTFKNAGATAEMIPIIMADVNRNLLTKLQIVLESHAN